MIMKHKILFDRYQLSYHQYHKIKDLIDENDIRQVELLIFLAKLKLNREEMIDFMQSSLLQRENLLIKHRQFLLDKIHEDYRLIDQIDEVLYQLKENRDG